MSKIQKAIRDLDIQRNFAACDIDKVIAYIRHPWALEENKYAAILFVSACMQHSMEYTQLMMALIQAGYDINHVDQDGMTSIQRVSAINSNNGIMLGLLLDSGADVNELGKGGFNAVHNAIKAGNYITLDMFLAFGGDVNLATKDGTLAMTMVMQSKVNMKKMFYVMVKHGVNLDCYGLSGLECVVGISIDMAGISIDFEPVNLVKSVLYADAMIGLRGESLLKDYAADINIVGARLAYYIEQLTATLGETHGTVVGVQNLLTTTCPDWRIEEIEQSLAFTLSINWAETKKLTANQIECSWVGKLVIPEMVDPAELGEEEDSASAAATTERYLISIESFCKLLAIIKKNWGVEVKKEELVEEEGLIVKLYNMLTKVENVDYLIELCELNHLDEMIEVELFGDVWEY